MCFVFGRNFLNKPLKRVKDALGIRRLLVSTSLNHGHGCLAMIYSVTIEGLISGIEGATEDIMHYVF